MGYTDSGFLPNSRISKELLRKGEAQRGLVWWKNASGGPGLKLREWWKEPWLARPGKGARGPQLPAAAPPQTREHRTDTGSVSVCLLLNSHTVPAKLEVNMADGIGGERPHEALCLRKAKSQYLCPKDQLK